MTKEPRIYNVERTVSSINSVGKTEYPYAEKRNGTLISPYIQKSTKKRIKDLNISPETVKLLEENIREKFLDAELGNNFLENFWFWEMVLCSVRC